MLLMDLLTREEEDIDLQTRQLRFDIGLLAERLVAATHALLVGPAIEWLHGLGLQRLVVTDSVALPAEAPLPLEVVSLDRLLAGAIERLHGASSPGATAASG